MHILFLPSFSADIDNENLGIFLKEQVYALTENNNKVGVEYVEMKSNAIKIAEEMLSYNAITKKTII